MDPGGSVLREICAAASLFMEARLAAVAGSGVVERSNERAAVAAAAAVLWTCAVLMFLGVGGLLLPVLGTSLPGWYAVTKQVARQAVSVHRSIIIVLQI
jgi:hypothetical protein